MDITTEQLIVSIAAGDTTAIAELYDQFGGLVYSIARAIVGNDDAAAEVTQDVFVETWQRASSFDPQRSSPQTWIARIARSRALDRVRRGQAHRRIPASVLNSLDSDDHPELGSVELGIELQGQRTAMNQALDQLPSEQRSLIRLAYLHGFSLAELAGETGLPVGTVKSRIFRGLAQLRQILDGETPTEVTLSTKEQS